MKETNRNTKWIIIGIAVVVALGLLVFFLFFYKNKNVRKTEEAIKAIGTVTLDSEDAIEEAEELYDDLTDAEKDKVENVRELEEAKDEYEDLCDRADAEKVDKLILSIGEVTRDSKDAIEEAKDEYEDLSKNAKQYVTELDTLEKAEAEYENIDVKECEELISAIGDVIDSPEMELPIAIASARSAYDALSDAKKAQVKNYANLEAAEKAYDEYYNKTNALKIKEEQQERLHDIQEYCNDCQSVTYAQLVSNSDTYKNKDVSIKISVTEVDEAKFLKAEEITAKPVGGKDDNEIVIVDKRKVKVPAFKEGMTLTVYGVFKGLDSDGKPEIQVKYTSVDDEQAINDQPTTTEVFNYIEEGLEIAKDVTDILKVIPW